MGVYEYFTSALTDAAAAGRGVCSVEPPAAAVYLARPPSLSLSLSHPALVIRGHPCGRCPPSGRLWQLWPHWWTNGAICPKQVQDVPWRSLFKVFFIQRHDSAAAKKKKKCTKKLMKSIEMSSIQIQ